MTASSLAPLVAALRQKGIVRPDDVLAMRLAVFDDAMISETDAEGLMGLDERVSNACAEWRSFFIEALTDFIVQQEAPRGAIDAANARWLMTRISRDATVKPNELELLIHVLETASSVPADLSRFAMKQIKHSVLFGESRNTVTESEVELMRRALFAGARTSGVVITREEAEVLFDIADAARTSDNVPAWTDFFAKAVANLMMASHGYTAPSREVSLRRGRWLNDAARAMTFDAHVLAALSNGLLANYSLADAIPGHDQQWLAERVQKDAMLSQIETALAERIKAEASNLHPTLQPLFEWAA
jgi:hypothetical protein